MLRSVHQDEDAGKVNRLNEKEIRFLKLAASELTYKEIADALNISVKTVEVHRYNVLKKLNLKNAAALVNFINNSQLDFEN